MIKKTLTAAAIAAMASTTIVPTAASAASDTTKASNPCAATIASNPCAAQNPCAAKNPCGPCGAASPCSAGASVPLTERDIKDVNTGYFDKVAIKGYDPVAYFTMSKAVKGSKEHTYDWLGATWHFANEEHRQTFAENPVKYAPQYGGYCAIGVAFNVLVPNIDPNAWVIHDGKLYIQYSPATDEDFGGDRDKLIQSADANWEKARNKVEK